MRNHLIACLLLAGPAAAQEASVEAGETLYQQHCRTCHVMTEGENRLGPSLHGLIGRDIGSVEGFAYSGVLESADGAWDEAGLDAFIEAPDAAYPGNSMVYPGMPDAEDRAALVAYLASGGEAD